ncbi:RNase HII [Scopulibacillus darangshiensis]|uniref:Ribonuclease HII n=1 Tax=Scopulibacillus darangshiensis TaxID=442528 RepID=A0A4R2P337_9BACL|nr:ribonuclease HII [Scopulibacillus darangshiensis]TCP29169.1 RNase HII [Scopulibacillus darangshiensis]
MRDKSIKEIEQSLFQLENISSEVRHQLEDDSRKGVQALLKRWDERHAKKQAIVEKYLQMSQYEHGLYKKGDLYIAGIDEAGRGPIAGPVVAAAVILKPDAALYGINDSKQLSKSRREQFFKVIHQKAVAIGVGIVHAKIIDEVNIYQAAKQAMIKAVQELDIEPDHLLIDAMKLPLEVPQTSLIKGDTRSISIAAASIIAKETRDRIMTELGQTYPEYQFSSHMGYGTKAHLQALDEHGPCPEHRMSFAPLHK